MQRLVDEAVDLGFTDVFFTGGEPFILNEIYEMLARPFQTGGTYAASADETSVLGIAPYQRSKVGRKSSFTT